MIKAINISLKSVQNFKRQTICIRENIICSLNSLYVPLSIGTKFKNAKETLESNDLKQIIDVHDISKILFVSYCFKYSM